MGRDVTNFKIVDLEQGTPEWLEWRSNGIGASDVPTILGENPWKDREQLFFEKCNPKFSQSQSSAMARGIRLEPIARAAYIERIGKTVAPACLQSLDRAWLRCSVDGITESLDQIVEIKCGESSYKIAKKNRTIPIYYYGQLQYILTITNIQEIDVWNYSPIGKPILIRISKNDWYCKRMLKDVSAFWERVDSYLDAYGKRPDRS